MNSFVKARWYLVPLFLIVLLGGYLRFTGLDWDGNVHLHPDERFLTDVASLLRRTDPLTYLKTSESTLNPYNVGRTFYVYGNFPMTVTRLSAEIADSVCQALSSGCVRSFTYYDGIQLIGRFLSASVDIVTIVLIFLIGRLLFDWRVALITAFLMAFSVLPIQQSHFFTMDNWAAMLTTATMYAAIKTSLNSKAMRWWAVFGIGLGLAVASRINVAPLAGVAPVAAIIWLTRRGQLQELKSIWKAIRTISPFAPLRPYASPLVAGGARPESGELRQKPFLVDLQTAILGLLVAAALSFVTFRIAQPYAFADSQIVRETSISATGREPGLVTSILGQLITLNPQWQANIDEIRNIQSPEALFPPALQWTDRTPILFPLVNMAVWGMGIGAGVLAVLAFIWALWRILRAEPEWAALALPVIWSGGYFLFMGTRWVKSIRYFLPVYPFLFLLAAWALVKLGKWASKNMAKKAIVSLIALGVFASSVLWSTTFLSIYQRPVTRIEASKWMFENVPSGLTLHYEVDGEPRVLQLPLRRFEFIPGGAPLLLNFTVTEPGNAKSISLNYVSNLDEKPTSAGISRMRASLIEQIQQGNIAQQEIEFSLGEPRETVEFPLPSTPIEAGKVYSLQIENLSGGRLLAATSVIASEHWDDALPVRNQGRDPYFNYYEGLPEGQIPITVVDSEQKRQDFYRWLDRSDYIVLSSQRALWSTPRIPLSYPLTMRYYDALFDGDLGFELAATFMADFSIGPLNISDAAGKVTLNKPISGGWPPPGDIAAEEAFSVYDHPPVWIFVKGDEYDPQVVRELLGAVDLDQVVVMTPGEATRAPNGLMVDTPTEDIQQRNGTFAEIFNLDGVLSREPWLAAIVWWIAIVLMGWISFPITFVVFRGMPDRGYPFSRILSLLVLSFFVWIPASLQVLPSTRQTATASLVVLLLINMALFWALRREIIPFIRQNLTLITLLEIVALGLYLLMLLIRLGNPDLWDVIWGGEKPMDLSYFTATMKSTYFPPYDPWYAGGYINYYYYGFVFVGVFTKLLGIVPSVAYNLILPMLFSFAGLAAFSVAFNLIAKRTSSESTLSHKARFNISTVLNGRTVAAGLLAAAFLVVLGNLGELGVLIGSWYKAGEVNVSLGFPAADTVLKTLDGARDLLFGGETAPIYPGDWFWIPTRAIDVPAGEVQPITEFPFFTFLYGDLHAHMIALPLALLALGWAVSLALMSSGQSPAGSKEFYSWPVRWAVGALAIGVLRATNTWDFPTYLFLGVLAVFFYGLRRKQGISARIVGQTLFGSVSLIILSIFFFLPFAENYGVGYTNFSLWPGSYTSLQDYLVIHGLFIACAVPLLLVEFRSWASSWTRTSLERWEPWAIPIIALLFLYVFILVLLVRMGYFIAPVVLTLVVFSGLLGLRPGLSPSRRIPLILISSGLGLTLIVEFVVLDGDIGRMNTVFKFYLQAWTMLSLASAVSVVRLWPRLRRRKIVGRAVAVTIAVLMAMAALYPIIATKAKWDIRMSDDASHTLDGMAFMEVTTYQDVGYDGRASTVHLSADYDAIRWMQGNIIGSPVVAEAHNLNPYRAAANRVAMYTGLPAIVGWDWHQRQQRAVLPASLISNRISDVTLLYNTTDSDLALDILSKYGVRYVYVGPLEQIYYLPQGLAKFDRLAQEGLLTEVYGNGSTKIYEYLSTSS